MANEIRFEQHDPPMVLIDSCKTCGATLQESLGQKTECVRQGHGCYFEVKPLTK